MARVVVLQPPVGVVDSDSNPVVAVARVVVRPALEGTTMDIGDLVVALEKLATVIDWPAPGRWQRLVYS